MQLYIQTLKTGRFYGLVLKHRKIITVDLLNSCNVHPQNVYIANMVCMFRLCYTVFRPTFFSVYGHEYRTALLYVQAASRLVFQLSLCTCRLRHVSCSSYHVRAGCVTSRVPFIIMKFSLITQQFTCTIRYDEFVKSTPRRNFDVPRPHVYINRVTFPRFTSLLCFMCALVSRLLVCICSDWCCFHVTKYRLLEYILDKYH